jgi:glyoxylate reductase
VRVFVTRDLPGTALDRLRAQHTVEVWPAPAPPTPEELAHQARHANGLLTLLTDRIDARLMDACPSLRAISNYAVGFENIDITAATARRIPVGHTPGVLTDATAQLAITMVLALLRRVREADADVRRGRWLTWQPAGHLGAALAETTIGLIGYGRIGQAVGRMAEALGMRVVHTDPVAGGRTMAEVLREADVLSLHAQLTPQTRGMIDRTTLSAMRRGSPSSSWSRRRAATPEAKREVGRGVRPESRSKSDPGSAAGTAECVPRRGRPAPGRSTTSSNFRLSAA